MNSVLHLTRNTRFTGGGPAVMSKIIHGLSDFEHSVGGLMTKRAILKSERYLDRIDLIDNCAVPSSIDLIPCLKSYRLSQYVSRLLKSSFPTRLSRRFRSYGFDLVHTHYSYAIDLQARAIVEHLSVPMIWTAHALPTKSIEGSQQFRRFDAICKRHPRLVTVVAVSKCVKEALRSLCPNANTVLVYNGSEIGDANGTNLRDLLQPLRVHHPDPFVICSVGRLNPEKGVEYLVRAARKVIAENDRAIFIHLGDGYLKNRLLSLVNDQGLRGRFFFLGHKERVADYLRHSDLFVLPSLNEAFGLSLLEALSVGLPSIVSDVGGIPEVTNINCSDFVPPADESAIAESILKLINDPRKLRRMSGAALGQSKKFSKAEMLSSYKSLYCTMIANSL